MSEANAVLADIVGKTQTLLRCTACGVLTGRDCNPRGPMSQYLDADLVICRTCGHAMIQTDSGFRNLTKSEAKTFRDSPHWDAFMQIREKAIGHLWG